MNRLAVLVCIASLLGPESANAKFAAPDCGSSTSSSRRPPTIDMIAAPEGVPHGALTPEGKPFGWAKWPRVGRGNQPQPGWSAILSTGMIYAEQRNQRWDSVRIEVRNLELFVKPRDQAGWCRLDHRVAPGGGLYPEDFRKAGPPARTSTLLGGGLSLMPVKSSVFHFWGNRVTLPAAGVDGIYVQYQARVRPVAGASLNSIVDANFVGAASADYWRSIQATDVAGLVNNEDVGIGRFKRLEQGWRLFTMNSNGTSPQIDIPHHFGTGLRTN